MAQRTISVTGGNINSTATFVEGAIPTSSDHIVGLSTSGPLVVNVSTTVQRLDLTEYTNLLTLNNTLTLGLSNGSTTFSATMSMTASSDTSSIACSVAHSFGHLGTSPNITNLRFGGSNITKTLNTDIYIRKLFYSSGQVIVNGNNFYIYSDLSDPTIGSNESTNFYGTTTHYLQGEGIVSLGFGNNSSSGGGTGSLIINGTYSTAYNFCRMFNNANLTIATAANCTDFNVWLDDVQLVTDNYYINAFSKFEGLYIETVSNNPAAVSRNINLGNTLYVDRIATQNLARIFTSDSLVPTIKFLGAGLSASEYYANPTLRIPSSGASPYPITYKSNDIELDPGFTHSIGNLFLQGVSTDKSYFSASSAGTVNLKVQNGADSAIGNYNFTNINASSGDTLYALNGTLTNTTNIQNTIPTGGGSASGPFAFAFIN